MDGGENQKEGELTKEELDSIDGKKDNLQDNFDQHIQKYLDEQIPKEKNVLKEKLQKDELPSSIEDAFENFEKEVKKIKQTESFLKSINSLITQLEGTVVGVEKTQQSKNQFDKYKDGELIPENLKEQFDVVDQIADEIDSEDYKVEGKTLVEKLWHIVSSGKFEDIFKILFSSRGKSAINGVPSIADDDLASAANLAEKKQQRVGKDNDEATLMYATIQSEAEYKLAQQGYIKAEIAPTADGQSNYVTKEGQTFKDALKAYLNGSEDLANQRIEEMQKMGIPLPDLTLPLPVGTHLYFGKVGNIDGYFVFANDTAVGVEELKTKTETIYRLAQKGESVPKTRLDVMEKNLQPGDFILMRSSENYNVSMSGVLGTGIKQDNSFLSKFNLGKAGKNAIEMEQDGFDFTHIVTYLGNGKVFNIHGGANAHITDLSTLMNDEDLSNGEYITLKNEHVQNDAERNQFIGALKAQEGQKYGNLIKSIYDRDSVNGVFEPVCSGVIQTAFSKGLNKNPFGKKLVSPGTFYEKLKVTGAGSLRRE